MTDPPLLGVSVWLAAALRGAHVVHWVQDIYPEIAAEITGHRWLLGLRPVRDFVWRRSRACIVPGRDMAEVTRHTGVPARRVLVSPNWAPAGLGPASASEIALVRAEWNLGGRLVLAYSGNLGRAHDLMPILDLAEIFRREETVVFVFIGGGPQRQSLEFAARTRGLANVRFLPPQPRYRLAATLGVGDVHFVTLRPGAERYVFPSKLHGIAASGRPVLFVGPKNSEIAALVEDTGIGRSFTREEIATAADWVRTLRASGELRARIGATGAALAGNDFARAKSVWRELLKADLASTENPRPMTAP
jgi:glycosyltransferase involved in cell wall biosynthesis